MMFPLIEVTTGLLGAIDYLDDVGLIILWEPRGEKSGTISIGNILSIVLPYISSIIVYFVKINRLYQAFMSCSMSL